MKPKERQEGFPRRDFLKTGLAGLAGLGFLSPLGAQEKATGETPKATLPQRLLGRTGISLPTVSMGVMNSDNPNLVAAALDAGITFLDTAHVYQRGRNEEMLGEVLKERKRGSFFLATKVPGGPMDRETGRFLPEASPDEFLQRFDLSLKRLRLDYVDILYLHGVSTKEAALYEPLLKAMERLKKDGRAHWLGVSTHSNEPVVMDAVLEGGVHDVVLTAYNFRQDHREEVKAAIARCAAKGVGIIAMKTQAGVYWDKEKSKPIDMRAALKWVLADKNVTTAIPGITTFEQLRMNLEVMKNPAMSMDERKALTPPPEAAGLFCQQCEVCLPQCPHNLPIPELMRGYMYAYGYRNLALAQEMVIASKVADNPCQGCGECSVRCAKGFDIRGRVQELLPLKSVPEGMLA